MFSVTRFLFTEELFRRMLDHDEKTDVLFYTTGHKFPQARGAVRCKWYK